MSKQNYKVTGTARYAKVFGEPQDNYQGDKREWSIDVVLDADSLLKVKQIGLESKLRTKDGVDGQFLTFTRTEFKSQKFGGGNNTNIPVFDAEGKAWPEDTSIGNGSEVQVKFGIFDIPAKGKFKGGPKAVIYEIKVLNLVEYKRPDAPPKKDTAAKPAANEEESYNDAE